MKIGMKEESDSDRRALLWNEIGKLVADVDFLKEMRELVELHERKDADYGGGDSLSNFKECEKFGIPAWKGVLIRMSDKWSRIRSLAVKNASVNETMDDTLADLAVYSIICKMLRKKSGKRHMVSFIDIGTGDEILDAGLEELPRIGKRLEIHSASYNVVRVIYNPMHDQHEVSLQLLENTDPRASQSV